MKNIVTTFCAAAAIFSAAASEYLRPEVTIHPIGKECTKKCQAFCPNVFRVQAWKIEDFNRLAVENAAMRCSMDDKNFYIELKMKDGDIVSEALDNKSSKLYNIADAVQILLNCDKYPNIWEINVTANNMSNCFFMPGGGAALPICSEKFSVKTEVKLDGSLNNSSDTDKSWSVKVTIPLAELRRKNLRFTADENWNILVFRNNFGSNLPARELSSFPQTLRNVYETARFARLVFPENK